MRVLPLGGSLLLPVALCLEEAVASASIVPHYTSFYLGFLSWSCEKAEMQLSKQAGGSNQQEAGAVALPCREDGDVLMESA
jgi:hypothetical protein